MVLRKLQVAIFEFLLHTRGECDSSVGDVLHLRSSKSSSTVL